jgi:hypothetical protein
MFADRAILAFSFAIGILAVLFVVYVAISLRPSDLQVASHYSAFGDTHFYRNKWYYLISFALFGIVFSVAHIGLMIKLRLLDMRPLAIAFGWLSLLLLAIAFVLTHSLLGIAFLS